MNRKYIESIDGEILALVAGHRGLRRFVLEAHSKATGEPMNRSERVLWSYIDAEFDLLLAELRKISPEHAKSLESFREPPPKS
jgi:hypothetical protein